MSDIIERAEAALEDEKRHPQRPWAAQGHSWIAAVWRAVDLIPELVAALKAARAENERLRAEMQGMHERGEVHRYGCDID